MPDESPMTAPSSLDRHTCILDDGGTPNRRCYACETEKVNPAPPDTRATCENCHTAEWCQHMNQCLAETRPQAKPDTRAAIIAEVTTAGFDEKLVPHRFVPRPGGRDPIWCRQCEYHRDHEIHRPAPGATAIRATHDRQVCATCGHLRGLHNPGWTTSPGVQPICRAFAGWKE